ncbi:oxidoreductase, partial [Streptomyces sp. 900105245]
TVVSPGVTRTEFTDHIAPEVRERLASSMGDIGIPPEAVARAIAFAVEQPAHVDVGDIVVRPTAQG